MHEIAPVPADAPVVERGVGFFETVLCLGRRVVLWDGHLARLFGSVAEFDFPIPDRALIEQTAAERFDAHPVAPGIVMDPSGDDHGGADRHVQQNLPVTPHIPSGAAVGSPRHRLERPDER